MNPYDELILTSDPVAYLPLDGRPTDLTGRHVPTITGSPGTTVLPNGDAAYSFNGLCRVPNYAEDRRRSGGLTCSSVVWVRESSA